MPNFSSPFGLKDSDKKLNDSELLRALRFAISAESEAIQVYTQFANSSDNKLFKKAMLDIAEEEKVHAGEFMKVLFELDPNEKEKYKDGFKEVNDMKDEIKALYKKDKTLALQTAKALGYKVKITGKQSAESEYKKRTEEIMSKILMFNKLLKQHKKSFEADKQNWGYVGDLGRYIELLDEMLGLSG